MLINMINNKVCRITFDCTDDEVFSFKNKKINKKSYNLIHEQLNPSQFDFVKRINIVYKKYKNFTFKNFEVLFDKIDDEQLDSFICKMKNSDFTSEKKCFIYCRNEDDDIVYLYDFNESIRISPPIQKKKTVDWNYKTQTLYKK
jgi:hypothetical protein